eukprot:2322662-Lingulodinium_polyedra.AAC.1
MLGMRALRAASYTAAVPPLFCAAEVAELEHSEEEEPARFPREYEKTACVLGVSARSRPGERPYARANARVERRKN